MGDPSELWHLKVESLTQKSWELLVKLPRDLIKQPSFQKINVVSKFGWSGDDARYFLELILFWTVIVATLLFLSTVGSISLVSIIH
jgi:hypothetical protein